MMSQEIDAFPYTGPGTSNRTRPAGRDRVLHAFACACRMSASRRKKGKENADISSTRDFWATRQLKDYLRKQEAASVEENLGWSRGMAKTTYDRSISIVTRWRVKVFFFFFVTFSRRCSSILISSWEWCSYSENQNAAALLKSLLRRTQHCRFPPSLASLNFLASRSLDPQMNTLPRKTLLFLELLLALKT